MLRILCLLCLCIALPLYASERLTIAAASDLRYALDEILTLYRQQQPQTEVRVIYGSSGKMTTQIRHGAPYDVFFSADIQFPQQLYQEGLAVLAPQLYAQGRIVLWSPRQNMSGISLTELPHLALRRLAIAQPSHAPYGQRAKEALIAAGVWQTLQAKLVYGENIAQTAQLAQSGGAEVAIIALSLAKFPELARHGYQLIPAEWHQPLTQAYTITRKGEAKASAWHFVTFMQSAAVLAILQQYGFEQPGLSTAVEPGDV